ncbi:hypothetical protein C8R46DRAFT_180113 [Mycena filopes]|nr:hypothetical protein C8R46DRAFT_180113 [Mycena filopes]
MDFPESPLRLRVAIAELAPGFLAMTVNLEDIPRKLPAVVCVMSDETPVEREHRGADYSRRICHSGDRDHLACSLLASKPELQARLIGPSRWSRVFLKLGCLHRLAAGLKWGWDGDVRRLVGLLQLYESRTMGTDMPKAVMPPSVAMGFVASWSTVSLPEKRVEALAAAHLRAQVCRVFNILSLLRRAPTGTIAHPSGCSAASSRSGQLD